MPAMRNLFFALVPPPALRTAFAREVVRLQAEWGGRPTATPKLHMTLLFLDAFPVPLDPDVVTAARAAGSAVALPCFGLAVDRADRFDRRVGWLGCSEVPAGMQVLHDALAEAVARREVPMRRESRFVPHVTVLRDPKRPLPHAIAPLPWVVDSFAMMASAEGAYEVLGRWPLDDTPLV